ncbi:MAG TPA: amidophosphoribosyltransferase [Longimicrobiales bacterium]|nr:amidophosphoribosyltransferase [Longimicrobiales bacterium]
MCGIVGVAGMDRAAELAYLGLYALQHRGQEAAGISAVDEHGRARLQREHGLVVEGFSDDVMDGLPGRAALGHVRYSTAGGPGLVNAQPLLVRYHQGDLALVHNGNITNAGVLRDALVKDGALFQTTVDSEVIVHLIAKSRAPTVDEQVQDALARLTGAFSVMITIGDTMYAARDPWGYRPLILGRLNGGHVIASESCALDLIGATIERDIDPGEIIRIRGGVAEVLPRLRGAERPAPCIFELVYFARPDSRIWGVSVDRARRAFGRQLAKEQPAEADCVFSVPDSSNSAALGFAEQSGIPYELGLIRNHYVGRTFIHPTQKGRDFRVRIKYNAVREVIDGKRVIVVDDSLVRGTTSRGLIALIREAGAKEVHFRVSSPPVTNPCYYGIDMPTKQELIGAQKTVEEIREHLNVDSLGYLSLEGMHSAVAARGPFCDACFSGNYGAPLVDLEMGRGLSSHC